MTTDTQTRARPIIRRVPPADGRGPAYDAHGWKCPCGADQGDTVLAIEADAQNAADQHTRENHLATVLHDLGQLHEHGNLKVGATFLGDIVRYTQDTEKGLYVETAAKGRYVVDFEHKATPYTDGATRPE